MRTLLILAAAALLITACGEDNPYEPDPTPNISIHIVPPRSLVDLGDSLNFEALNIHNVSMPVVWEVEDEVGGNQTYGTIDSTGLYLAPNLVPDLDSVSVVATLINDISIKDTAWAVLIDPTKVHVDTSGSDTTGTGSRFAPFRTITHALTQADSSQEIIIAPGLYEEDEQFPIEIALGMTLVGAGYDSTIVRGPGTNQDRDRAVFAVEQPGIQIKNIGIRTLDPKGIGIWMQGTMSATNIFDNDISGMSIGIYVEGPGTTVPTIEDNIIKRDSIGIFTSGACRPNILNNIIDSCWIYGVQIDNNTGLAGPFLGDTTFAGGNYIRSTGQYLLYNSFPDTIWAIGNDWGVGDPDPFIYDDEESSGASGPVITRAP